LSERLLAGKAKRASTRGARLLIQRAAGGDAPDQDDIPSDRHADDLFRKPGSRSFAVMLGENNPLQSWAAFTPRI